MDARSQTNLTIKGAHRVAAVISGGIIGSLFIMAIIAEVVRGSIPGGESVGVIRTVSYVVGFATILLARFVSSAMRVRNPNDKPEHLLLKLVRASVVTAAVCELPGILGFVLAILGGERIDMIILMMMSVGLCWIFFPRLDRWREFMGTQNAHAVS